MNSQDQQRIGNYTFTTNPWNKGSIVNFSTCVTGNTTPTGVQGKITWSWPVVNNEVKAYPEIMYRPNGQPPNIAFSELGNTTSNYDVSVTATGQYNVAYDIWIDSSKQPDHWPHKAEIMIKVAHTWNDGPVIDTVVLDGVTYDVAIVNVNIQGSWPAYMFQTRQPVLKGSIKLKSFTDYLTSHNYLLYTDVMSTIEFGSEIVDGTGTTTVNSYSITR
jgi:hypothetical protein